MVCEAVPGAKGATRRRKVHVGVGGRGKALRAWRMDMFPHAEKAQILRLRALS